MALEIEHKYIVISEIYKDMAEKRFDIIQGYLSKDKDRTVRVRIINDRAFLTVKGRTHSDTREEYEYPIPVDDARKMLQMCIGSPVRKIRSIVYYKGFRWEVDEFIERDTPTIAEIELTESHRDYTLPPFVGEEVTGDPRYYNSNL